MDKGKKAFTLAEVLITLAIIGVLAALSLPSLIQSANHQEYVTSLKKFYLNGNQALARMAADYGCTGDLKCTEVFGTDYTGYVNRYDKVGQNLARYFNVSKNCGITNQKGSGCWVNPNVNYDGTGGTLSLEGNNYNFITADGMSVSIVQLQGTNCPPWNFPNSNGQPVSQFCSAIDVDVNGIKGPNRFGRDVFQFWITNGIGPLLYPDGGLYRVGIYWKSTGTCSSGNTSAIYCAARVIEEGWQMNY